MNSLYPFPNSGQLWPSSDERQNQAHPDPPNISKDETAALQITPRFGAVNPREGVLRGPRRPQDINRRFAEYDEDRGPWRQYQHDPM